MVKKTIVAERVRALVEQFAFYVEKFDRKPAFTDDQLNTHLATLRRRRELANSRVAVADNEFLDNLYNTLRLWKIGRRKSKLVPFAEFTHLLHCRGESIAKLDRLALDEKLDIDATIPNIWNLIETLGIVDNQNTVVAGTKCLHHILPELVPPMDRDFTVTFFDASTFQSRPKAFFDHAFRTFAYIAKHVNPVQYIGERWRSSGPKIIDNAVVSFCQFNGIESRQRIYNKRRKIKMDLMTARAKELGIYDELIAKVGHA
jgi:hypothetical protein